METQRSMTAKNNVSWSLSATEIKGKTPRLGLWVVKLHQLNSCTHQVFVKPKEKGNIILECTFVRMRDAEYQQIPENEQKWIVLVVNQEELQISDIIIIYTGVINNAGFSIWFELLRVILIA